MVGLLFSAIISASFSVRENAEMQIEIKMIKKNNHWFWRLFLFNTTLLRFFLKVMIDNYSSSQGRL